MSMSGSPKQPDIVMQVACGKKTPDTPKPMSRSQPPQRQKRADDRSGVSTRCPGADRCLSGVCLLRRGRAACRAKSWFASSHTHALERAGALLTCQYLELASGMEVRLG